MPSTFLGVIVLIVIAAICGSVGAKLAGASNKGCIASIVLGIIGAFIGRWLSEQMDMSPILEIAGIPVIWSIIGATLFVAVINFISGGSSEKKDKK